MKKFLEHVSSFLLGSLVALCGVDYYLETHMPAKKPYAPPQGTIQAKLIEDPQTGDYKLYVSGGRQTVCEEKGVTVIQQPDAVTDLVIECSHAK